MSRQESCRRSYARTSPLLLALVGLIHCGRTSACANPNGVEDAGTTAHLIVVSNVEPDRSSRVQLRWFDGMRKSRELGFGERRMIQLSPGGSLQYYSNDNSLGQQGWIDVATAGFSSMNAR